MIRAALLPKNARELMGECDIKGERTSLRAILSEGQLITELLKHCGWPARTPAQRLKDKACLVRFYRDVCSHTRPNTDENATTLVPAIPESERSALTAAFAVKYNSTLFLGELPSEGAFNLAFRAHSRRSADFILISKIVNAIDGRDTKLEPHRITVAPFLLADDIVRAKIRRLFSIARIVRPHRPCSNEQICARIGDWPR